MSWILMPAHAIAHVEPTLSVGTAHANYAKGNINTLDPNSQGRFNPSVGAAAQLRWDRGEAITTGNDISGVAFINHNFGNKGQPIALYGGATAGTTTDTLYSATPANNKPIFATFTSNLRRHLRLDLGVAADTDYYCGTFTVGPTYDLGNPVYGEQWMAGPNANSYQTSVVGTQMYTGSSVGSRVVSAQFRKVTRANANAIIGYYHQQYINSTLLGSTLIQGIGGGGGANPIVLKDNDGVVYYGPAEIRATSWIGPNCEIQVTLREVSYPRAYGVP